MVDVVIARERRGTYGCDRLYKLEECLVDLVSVVRVVEFSFVCLPVALVLQQLPPCF